MLIFETSILSIFFLHFLVPIIPGSHFVLRRCLQFTIVCLQAVELVKNSGNPRCRNISRKYHHSPSSFSASILHSSVNVMYFGLQPFTYLKLAFKSMICSREYTALVIYVDLMDIPFSTIILREAKSGMVFYFHSTFWGSVH